MWLSCLFALLLSSAVGKGEVSSETPLHTAIREGNIALARQLLEQGADMYALDSAGETPLHVAILVDSLPGIRLFEEFHFELDRRWGGGDTVLHTAADTGSFMGMRLLLQNGSSVDLADDKDRTPMALVIARDSGAKVYLLAGFRADLKRVSKDGFSYLHTAVNFQKHVALVALLKLGLDPEVPDEDLQTPLELALANDDTTSMDLLSSYGAELGKRDSGNRTLLMVAAEQGALSSIDFLIKRGNLSTEDGDTNGNRPLHYAVSGSRLDSVKALLQNGAEVDGTDVFGGTPLQSASSKGSLPIVRWLINAGADVNSHTIYNWTSLLGASLQGHLPVVKLLLAEGARVGDGDQDGWTAMHCGALWGQTPVIRELLQWNATVDPRDKDGFTPLHRASWNGHLSSAQLLLDSGADVNARTNNGTTPLYYSQLYNHTDVSDLLKSRGGTL